MDTYLITFALAVGSVALWTLRVTIASRGNRAASAVVSMVEATTYVVAVSRMTGAVGAPLHVAIYAAGVGAGTYAGLYLDGRLAAVGRASVRQQVRSRTS